MDFAAASHFAQTFGLALLIALFAAVLLYALWPGNRKKFEHAARTPLDDDNADNGKD
ncbi:MAG: cbb3-type cytochrome c oxidase subunit 3 [Hyphomonadaceae bacterium]|nr:cbb3-type cytochrome c oxidase subunit 3 [Hyphomonadaceae bacterium]